MVVIAGDSEDTEIIELGNHAFQVLVARLACVEVGFDRSVVPVKDRDGS